MHRIYERSSEQYEQTTFSDNQAGSANVSHQHSVLPPVIPLRSPLFCDNGAKTGRVSGGSPPAYELSSLD